jgi:hypothetical protein
MNTLLCTSHYRHVRPLVEQALQQNEAVDIYSDVFTANSSNDENEDPNSSSNTNPLMKQVFVMVTVQLRQSTLKA